MEYLRSHLLDFDLIQMYELVEKPLISVLCEIEKMVSKLIEAYYLNFQKNLDRKLRKLSKIFIV
ncbi:MAG: hypothetical protein CM15mP111_0590 [Hyphomicrobiales bacterium]|nr:MAG: hypothetical protein CM15mP111_0590 [Hyphomicrobiales bacterium]